MKDISFTVSNLDRKERADKLMASVVEGLSRNRIQMLVDEGNVKLNGVALQNASEKLKNGDVIEIHIDDPKPTHIKPKKMDIDIVYEDDDLLVINKPFGMTVHPGAGNYDDTLVNGLLAEMGDNLSGINGVMRPGIVHRLDRDTTGLMLVAKNDKAHAFLSEAIKNREVTRIYHALVWNAPALPAGKIEANIGRHPRERKKMAVLKSTGRTAITHYKLLETFFDRTLSLVECKLETGRTHQIRVHFEHKGMPLVGDLTYSGQITQKKVGSLPEPLRNPITWFHRQALHARYLAFTHPSTLEEMEFEAPYPYDFATLLKLLDYEKHES